MNERDELEDEYNAQWGDPRRCPVHGIATSSPDGMFDAPCWACEAEGEQHAYEAGAYHPSHYEEWEAEHAHDPAPTRPVEDTPFIIDDTPF